MSGWAQLNDAIVLIGERYGWCSCGHGWLCHAIYADDTFTDRVWVPCTAPGCKCQQMVRA